MLPSLRILPVGGVVLAILLLALALNPPASMHAQLMPSVLPMRGAIMARSEHPEWQQFLILSAIRRADELKSIARTAGYAGPHRSCTSRVQGRRPADRAHRHGPGSRRRDRVDHAAAGRDHSDRYRRALGVRVAGGRAGRKAAGDPGAGDQDAGDQDAAAGQVAP